MYLHKQCHRLPESLKKSVSIVSVPGHVCVQRQWGRRWLRPAACGADSWGPALPGGFWTVAVHAVHMQTTTLPGLGSVKRSRCRFVQPPDLPEKNNTHPPRDVLEGKGPQRRPQKRLDRRLEEVAEAVGGRLLSVTNARGWHLASGGQWLGIGWAPWRRGRGVPPPPPSNVSLYQTATTGVKIASAMFELMQQHFNRI